MPQPSTRVAIVTGSAGAVGVAVVATLLKEGYAVFGFDRVDHQALDRFTPVIGDVTSDGDVRTLVAAVEHGEGRLDLLVNNAGIDTKVDGPLGEVDPLAEFQQFPLDKFNLTLQTNVVGPLLLVQKCLPLLRNSPAPSVVNISSIYGVQAPNQRLYRDSGVAVFKGPDYPVSKAALISLTTYLAATVGSTGIRVNAVSPGGIDLGQSRTFVEHYEQGTPLGRMASVQDVADAVLFLASDGARYITGHNLIVDGGRTIW